VNLLVIIASALSGLAVLAFGMGLREIFAPVDKPASEAKHKKVREPFRLKRVTVQRDFGLMLLGTFLGACASAAVSIFIALAGI
jgi:hypothetical protein